jgi:hypothetical protein
MRKLPNEKIQGTAESAPDGTSGDGGTEWDALSEGERYRMIAEAAYFRAERRGFTHGSELQDWIEAAEEIKQRFGKT